MQKAQEREDLAKQHAVVEKEIAEIKHQYEHNKNTVLKQLIETITNVKLEVPEVVKASFAVSSRDEDLAGEEVF